MACCLTTASHYLNQCWLIITVKSSDIHIRAILQEMPQPSITNIRLKIIYLKFHSDFPGANQLQMKSPIQINKIQHLNANQLTQSSKVILDDIKGNSGPHSVQGTSQWLLHVITWKSVLLSVCIKYSAKVDFFTITNPETNVKIVSSPPTAPAWKMATEMTIMRKFSNWVNMHIYNKCDAGFRNRPWSCLNECASQIGDQLTKHFLIDRANGAFLMNITRKRDK